MADFTQYFDHLMALEGGFVDDPLDRGNATKWGVTLSVWIKNGYDKNGDGSLDKTDIKLLSRMDAYNIAKKLYWDKIKGDQINNQSLAEFIFDWAYNSGVGTASRKVQSSVGVETDGIIGSETIKAVNAANQEELFNNLKFLRERFFKDIVRKNPSQKRFLAGWLNRLNSFKFKE